MRRERRGEAGGTLIEVLIALALAGLVVSATLGLPGLMLRFEQRAEQSAAQREAALAAGRLFRALVEGAVPAIDPAEPTVGSATRLDLISRGPRVLAFDRPRPTTLRVATGTDGVALVLAWTDPETGAAREEVVVDGARSIAISYFGRPSPRGALAWHDRWDRPRTLPAAYLLRLDLAALGPPMDIIARPAARYPEACILLPHEPACER